MKVIAVDQPHVPPLAMSQRFRTEIVYFMTPAGVRNAPATLGPNEYWISLDDARHYLEDLVVLVVSPLDSASKAEIELSEEHETWLEWLIRHNIQHVRIEP
jgi:hypothetical protein